MNDIAKAKKLLDEGYTCVLVKQNEVHLSKKTGIKPMMEFIAQGIDLTGFCVADKIVGKAVALLFVYAKVKEVYAATLSEKAIEVFNKYQIGYSFNELTKEIINRTNTGICPMEAVVLDIDDPVLAYQALKEKLMELSK